MSILNNQIKSSARSQRGYSLIELSIAMAILSVIIVGSLTGVQRILANNRTNNVLQFIPRLNATLISGTLGGNGGTVITTNLATSLGAFEPNIVAGAGAAQTIRNEFGGQYAVISNSAVVGAAGINGGYFVYITGVPNNVCPILANGLSSLADGMWIALAGQLPLPAANANAGQAAPANGQVQVPGGAFNVANAGTQCSLAGANTKTITAFIPMS
ncbi:prepilin-type N-terminal cleavage/methylation domain-containing protein [Methylobacillus glycogenes]|uniref:prepilin-type N-terminal cleavage/methylation domain-containing protein n=1 Tax=Methylobacillus glycogenes TaxID=406 RepID=UPI000470765F|nr:prepilin-type N-terminal cleavage/methylation domain-containing protein [Methylobacillus glycogenes]